MRRRRQGVLGWAALAALAALAAGACAAPAERAHPADASADAGRCRADLCAPYACDPAADRCFQACGGDAMCAAGFACDRGACVGTQCTPETAAAICGAYACVNGVCVSDCAVGPCADGFYCRGDTGACVPRCTHLGDPDCDGYVCQLDVGECEAYCHERELACAAGYVCVAGDLCVEDVSAPSCAAGCGAYACLPRLDRCATRCLEDDDCAIGATCMEGACI